LGDRPRSGEAFNSAAPFKQTRRGAIMLIGINRIANRIDPETCC
jgi:hypothetical protein